MNVLVVATFCHPDHFGGAERVIHDVSEALAARGHAVTLLTSNPGDLPASEIRAGVSVHRYPVQRGSPLRFYRSVVAGVRAALRAGVGAEADVLAVHQMLSAVAALSMRRGRACVATFHAPYHREYLARHRAGRDDGRVAVGPRAVARLLRVGDRRMVRRADEILVLSRFAAGQVGELAPHDTQRVTVAPAGVDLARYRPARDEAERRELAASFGLDVDIPCVVTVRRLVPRMGLPDLIEACRLLTEKSLEVQLAMAGEGEQRDALSAQIERAGLTHRVHLLGRVPEPRLAELYRAGSVFALPTRALEGFGMATAEALASGLPVVATRVGANEEVLEPVAGARLVAPNDPAGLADALGALLADEPSRREAARTARTHAERALHWGHHVDAFEQAAERALVATR